MLKTIHLDSTEQNIFFTADPHFGHANIIEYCDRPFKDVYEMNQVLVGNWNAVVDEKDIVFVLGDFSMKLGSSAINHIFYALRGTKYLVLGNHDRTWKQAWEGVDKRIDLFIKDPEIPDGQRITLDHFPMLSWYHSHKGSWQLFGHVHGVKMPITPNQLDVGADVHNFRPIHYQRVKEIITKQNLR